MLTLNDGRKELYQWDTGRMATVDVECDVVHFSNLKYGESLAVEVKEGKVAIPNQLLMRGEIIYCWAFAKDESGTYTKKEQTLAVTKRAKPSDYLYTETEVISVKNAVKQGLEEAKASGEFKGEKGDIGERGQMGPAGPQGIKGDKGDKGDRGDDGYTPQKGVDYFTPDDIASLNIPSVDQIYTPGSENAQSGKSVAEAVTAEKNRSDITFSNALKGSKSGSAILIDDVSPIEHNMIVRVSSDTLTDLSTVTIYKYGKNLFNLNKVQNATLTTYMNKPCLSYVDGAKYFVYTSNFKEDTQYTFTTKAYREDGVINKPITVTFWYTDGTRRSQIMDAGKIYSITSTAGKTLTKISGNDNYGKKCYIDLSVTQLEIGTTASEYEPFIKPVDYKPRPDGVVNGVTSLYPNTTLTTDTNGVLIECEYNRDINKAFAELQQAIISLGGNV